MYLDEIISFFKDGGDCDRLVRRLCAHKGTQPYYATIEDFMVDYTHVHSIIQKIPICLLDFMPPNDSEDHSTAQSLGGFIQFVRHMDVGLTATFETLLKQCKLASSIGQTKLVVNHFNQILHINIVQTLRGLKRKMRSDKIVSDIFKLEPIKSGDSRVGYV